MTRIVTNVPAGFSLGYLSTFLHRINGNMTTAPVVSDGVDVSKLGPDMGEYNDSEDMFSQLQWEMDVQGASIAQRQAA